MGILKELWDMITTVEFSIAAWRTTLWREVQVEDMELECKRFSKDIRGLDKEVRGGKIRTYSITYSSMEVEKCARLRKRGQQILVE